MGRAWGWFGKVTDGGVGSDAGPPQTNDNPTWLQQLKQEMIGIQGDPSGQHDDVGGDAGGGGGDVGGGGGGGGGDVGGEIAVGA